MRFVPIKDVDQQSVLMLHRARALLIASGENCSPSGRGHNRDRVRAP